MEEMGSTIRESMEEVGSSIREWPQLTVEWMDGMASIQELVLQISRSL